MTEPAPTDVGIASGSQASLAGRGARGAMWDKCGDRQLITRDPAGPAAHAALLLGLCAEAVSFGPMTGAAQAAWKQSWFSSVHGSTLFGYD